MHLGIPLHLPTAPLLIIDLQPELHASQACMFEISHPRPQIGTTKPKRRSSFGTLVRLSDHWLDCQTTENWTTPPGPECQGDVLGHVFLVPQIGEDQSNMS